MTFVMAAGDFSDWKSACRFFMMASKEDDKHA